MKSAPAEEADLRDQFGENDSPSSSPSSNVMGSSGSTTWYFPPHQRARSTCLQRALQKGYSGDSAAALPSSGLPQMGQSRGDEADTLCWS
jgi:hypothetical protein